MEKTINSEKIIMLDSTLREGELHSGIYYTLESRRKIGLALAELGTPRIEFPIAYPGRVEVEEIEPAIDAIKNSYNSQVVLQCGASKEELESITKYNIDGAGIYLAITEPHRRERLHGRTIENVLDKLIFSADYLKEQGFGYRRVTLEDVSRIFSHEKDRGPEDTVENFVSIIKILDESPATGISIPDTSGRLLPDQAFYMFQTARRLTTKELSAHFHNDRGLALTNMITVAGYADEAQATIAGFGARNGITDHYSFSINYRDPTNREILLTGERRELFKTVYRIFEEATGIPIPSTNPLSEQSRTERGGRHQHAEIKNRSLFIPMEKAQHDLFENRVYMEIGRDVSKHVVYELIKIYGKSEDEAFHLTEECVARSKLVKRELSSLEIRDLAKSKIGIDIPLEEIDKMIRGPDIGLVMLHVKPQANDEEMKRKIKYMEGVKEVNTTYGGIQSTIGIQPTIRNVDMVIKTRLTTPSGRRFVSLLREIYGDSIEIIAELSTD